MMFGVKKWRLIFLAVFPIVVFGGLLYWQFAFAVTRTWDGGGTTNNWSECANWSADTCPTSSDLAVFDGTSTKNATINTSLSGSTAPAGIAINAGYTGTITQSSGVSIVVGFSNFSQASGIFVGGDSAITTSGTFSLSGGTFTSTSATLQIGTYGMDNTTVFFVSGGTFNHNNGTVKFVAGNQFTRTYTIDVPTSLTLYNIIWDTTGLAQNGPEVLTTASGDTVIAANNFTHANGTLEGTWQSQGDVTITSAADGGTGTLTMTGVGSKTYAYSAGGRGSYLRINNAALSVSAAGGTSDLAVGTFSLLSGTFFAPPGTLQIGFNGMGDTTVFFVSGGTFNHNNGTVKFIAGNQYARTFTIDVVTSLTLYDIEWNTTGLAQNGPEILKTASGDTVIAANNFTLTNGTLDGTWQVQGNVIIGSSADGGSAVLAFTGTNNQTYTDQGGNEPDGDITVNKSAGTLTLASNADWNATSQDLTITSGALDIAGYTTNVAGTLAVGSSGTLQLQGSETVGYTTLTLNSGSTVAYNGSGTYSSLLLGNTYSNLAFNGSGTWSPSGNLTVNSGTSITAGRLVFGSTRNFSTTALTVGTNGILKMTGTGDLILGGNVSNSGVVIIESNQTCGGTDDIQILSSSAGVQRTWSGSGAYTIYDAYVKDQGGTAAITAYSSTNVSNNGANWTFSGAACPAIPPAASVGSGTLNIGSGIVNFR